MLLQLESTLPAPKQTPRRGHVWVVDVSGSMYSELPVLRGHLVNRLATHLKVGDELTIIYYSSNGTFGYVLERFTINDPTSLTRAGSAIETFLRPMSLTGFVDPLRLAKQALQKFREAGLVTSLLFMSDGYENQNPEALVLDVTKALLSLVDAGAVIEYGDYANHVLLAKMADALSVPLVYSEQAPDFDELAARVLSDGVDSTLTTMGVDQHTRLGFTVQPDTGLVTTYRPVEGIMSLRMSPGQSVFLLREAPYEGPAFHDVSDLLAAAIAAVSTGEARLAWEILGDLGDIDLIDRYAAAIGKQRRNQFIAHLYAVKAGEQPRFPRGKNPGYLPRENAFCLLDLLDLLEEDGQSQLLVRHPSFKYKRGTAARVSDTKLKFVEDRDQAVTFGQLVRSSSRANLSVRGQFTGHVDLSVLPDAPVDRILTHVYRTYTLVRDGVVTMDEIPVELSQRAHEWVSKHIPLPEFQPGAVTILKIRDLPVVNRAFIQKLDGKELAYIAVRLEVLKAVQKVFRYYEEALGAKQVSPGWVDTYGSNVTAWLKDHGLTEHSGFSPTGTTASLLGDSYVTSELDFKIKGVSSLPSVTAVLEKKNAGKTLNNADRLMEVGLQLYGSLVSGVPDPLKAIREATADVVHQKRVLEWDLAERVFTKLLSGTDLSGLSPEGGTTVELSGHVGCSFMEQGHKAVHLPNRLTCLVELPSLSLEVTVVETEKVVEI